jgi:2-dehydro-3-deoxygalactonokinase
MSERRLIVVDWGTTSFRARLIEADGTILDEITSGRGMRDLERSAFAAYCAERTAAWRDATPPPPIYMAGMVGAPQGWTPAPQPPLPLGPADLARLVVPADGLADAWIVPGARFEAPDGTVDVMRGEEVQIFGALALTSREDAVLCLPGTHSKWARARGGRLESFTTFMTGEVYQVMLEHSILAKTAEAGAPFDEAAFTAGLEASAASVSLLHTLFLTRSLTLWDRLEARTSASFLSGVLIGEEVRAARGVVEAGDGPVLVVAGEALRRPYDIALGREGLSHAFVPAMDASLHGIRALIGA